ncbi:MAG: hypothetical protein LBC02_00920 [Planctomycetaceae bacterium]|jgi:hypothetical protein|nr:hypothetical protein [Planctomycetaceae bacterium]
MPIDIHSVDDHFFSSFDSIADDIRQLFSYQAESQSNESVIVRQTLTQYGFGHALERFIEYQK